MGHSIKHRLARLEALDEIELRKLLGAILTDLTNLKTDVTALDTGLDVMAAKLNLDDGVTDANYAGAVTAMTSGTLNLEA